MSDKIRAFVALKLPANTISAIKRVQEDFKRHRFPVRWVRPENVHLTIKFFGDIPKNDVTKIDAAMKSCAGDYAPLSLSAKGAGIFPGIARPRIIWAGISGETFHLLDLRNSLEKRFEEIGFKKEERPFKGHLTIGRFREKADTGKLLEALKKVRNFESEMFVAWNLYLYKSDLKPEGPVYTELLKVPLTGDKIV
ncbi:MAG: RNA 2',3'-cyclic phosphodiesterase [Desulfobacteraceae bacterium]|nr:MAG: RNA 2',3'-cyclic phosphodiesterase [Desulfobacteraceae bacterium]